MQQIGNYKITEKVAEGGMAVVYEAIQASLSRKVAIKILKQKFKDQSVVVNYFERESLIIARLIHPNIIHVIDRGLTEKGMPFFVMNFIKGTDTAHLIKKGGLTFNRKLDIVVHTCKALAYAHKNGVIHRDIKPANILIDLEGNAVVTDFGIAQFYQSEDISGKKEIAQNKKRELLGTPSYMSPEQKIDSANVTFASDIYSLGVVMYEIFTGKRFPKKIERPSAIAPEIPIKLDKIILQCLSYDPDKRPASVELIKNQLFVLFRGAHLGESQKQKALSGAPAMNDIFSILDIIREKETGSVYLLRHKQSEQLMVAKTFNVLSRGIKTARLLLSLKHTNIVDIQGVSGSGDNSIVVMEYLSGGSLADLMVMPHSWQESIRIIQGVCRGLFFAHNNRITHGNLKPANILFFNSDEVKVSDFGFGNDKSSEKQLHEQILTDILATGAIFYKMILGFSPVVNGESFTPHKKFKTLPDGVKRLIFRLLSQNPRLRFQSMKQVLDEIDIIYETEYDLEETAITLDEDLSDSPQKMNPKDSPLEKSDVKGRRSLFFIFVLLLIIGFAAAVIFLHFNDPNTLNDILQSTMTVFSRIQNSSYFKQITEILHIY